MPRRTIFIPVAIMSIPLLALILLAPAKTLADTSAGDPDDPFYDPFTNKGQRENVVRLHDPLEIFNRATFFFNDKLYFYALKPAAQGYKYIVPEPGRIAVKRFFLNLMIFERLVNCAVQCKFKPAGIELWRFIVNTTVGMAGLFDPARNLYISNRYVEDFGQTMGYYGIKSGYYLVLPFFGPSSMRDVLGLAVDSFLDPLTYLNVKTWEHVSLRAYSTVNNMSLRIGEYEDFKQAAIDPYVAMRDGYAQYRETEISR